MDGDKPMSLYLCVKPKDRDRLKPLIRLIINQIVNTLTDVDVQYVNGQQVKCHKHDLLLALDEFPQLGRLHSVESALAFMAGFGLKGLLVTQDLEQLYASYGQNETISSNCHVKIAYAPNRDGTAKALSESLGTSTVLKEQWSESRQGIGPFAKKSYSRSYQEVARPLMTPAEIKAMPPPLKAKDKIVSPGDMLIIVTGMQPIYGRQILYFMDPVFKTRSSLEPPSIADTGA
jgi:type IV secretion system protein VirD4